MIKSPRASSILVLIAKLGYVTQAQLRKLAFASGSHTEGSRKVVLSRILRSLEAGRLIRPLPRSVGGPNGGSAVTCYVATPRGRTLARTFDASAIGSGQTGRFLERHALAVTDVLVAFKRATDVAGRRLIAWRTSSQLAEALGHSPIIPDLYLSVVIDGLELEAAVEVDLGTEGSRFFAEKVDRYLAFWRSGAWRDALAAWPIVLVVTASDHRAELLWRATERVLDGQPDRALVAKATEFAFISQADLTRSGPFVERWLIAGKPSRHALVSGTSEAKVC